MISDTLIDTQCIIGAFILVTKPSSLDVSRLAPCPLYSCKEGRENDITSRLNIYNFTYDDISFDVLRPFSFRRNPRPDNWALDRGGHSKLLLRFNCLLAER